jgi:hypothetical protein
MWRAAWSAMLDAVTPPRMVLELPAEHTFDTAPRPIDMLLTAMRNNTGTSVSREEALSVAAVARARNELCAISTLPLRLFKDLAAVDSPLFRQFDIDVPNVVHMARTIEDLAFEQIAWWEITSQDFPGYPASVRRIDPAMVSLDPPGKGSAAATIPGVTPLGTSAGQPTGRQVWIDRGDGRGPRPVPASLMIRFDSPQPGILRSLGRMIRIAILLDRLIEMYADNPQLKELFTDNPESEEENYTDDEANQFITQWAAVRKMIPVGWLPSQVKRVDVNAPSPKDLTLVELRQEVNLAIANGLGVDPEDLGVSTTSRTYFNSVDKKQDKINRTYAPYMSAITDRLRMGDVTPRGYTPAFDLVDYLKSDPVTQAQYWAALKEMKVVDSQWIGEQANIDPAVTARAAAADTAPAAAADPAIGGMQARRGGPRALTGRHFDADLRFTFHATDFADAPPAPTVDQATRTITGLAVPYGAVANKYGMKITFDAGSLEYSEPARMAHLMDHMTPVGFHRSITDGPAGPVVSLAVLDGPEGSPVKAQRDQLLYDAEHGLYSGLSVGVDYSLDPEDGDVTIDDDGVYHVVRATWRETSTTYMPAFDDARVTRVAATRTGGNPMDPCQHCGQRHAPNIACATFRSHTAPPVPPPAPPVPPEPQPDPQSFAAFTAWQHTQRPPALPAGPTAVDPHHTPAQVTEPPPYRFDRQGNLRAGTHDFSADLFKGWHPSESDAAARSRAETFLRETFDPDAKQFAITPANVTALNYPANRPDMYVDQLEYQYPLWDAVNKGTLADVTPFVIPKFSSSSGLVADHVTGTEPTPGAFTATAQTLTPSAVSGKVEITREAFDQGGNPQMSGLIFNQMRRGYYEALEQYVQAQLVALAASITDITITTAAVDSVLDQALTAALVPLQYVRGGDRFRKVFTQIDLYKAMAAAKDSAGRRLYPAIGPQNAMGTIDPQLTQIDAHGKQWIPAWATAATGVVAASSWMFDPEKVCAWATPPQRIDIVWRVAWVDMGIWGYKAFGVTDFNGIRELVYDPV